MDKFALRSHELAIEGYKKGFFEEVTPLFDWQGNVYSMDNGIRATPLLKLSQVKASI